MTKPTTIFFGPDGRNYELVDEQKVVIRTLLYSTSDKGQYIQNMFVRLQRGESIQNFNVWVYDDNGLVRGSGLFISKEGKTSNHHFLLPRNTSYDFRAGDYKLQLLVEAANGKSYKIFEQILSINRPQEEDIKERKKGIYYDWAPNSQNYEAHVNGISKKDRIFPDLI